MFHRREVEDDLNLRFTELVNRFQALSAYALMQGVTFKSRREAYQDFVGSLITDPELREENEPILGLEGDSSCGDDSNRCCHLFTGDKHEFSTTDYKKIGFSYFTPHHHLADMQLELNALHAKKSVYQTEKEEFLSTDPFAIADQEKYLALQQQKIEMLAGLSEKQKEELLTLIRAKMQSLTSTPAKGDDDEFESLIKIHDSIQASMDSVKKLDVITVHPASLRENIQSEYDILIGLLGFQEQKTSADIRKLEKLSERLGGDYHATHRHLLDRIEHYPCLIRMEFARPGKTQEWTGSHSFMLYLTSPNQFHIYQSDFGKFTLAKWMESEEKTKLEARGLLNFCKLLGHLESEDLLARKEASAALRKGHEYSDIQRIYIKYIPVDKSIGLRNIEELDSAATLEYRNIMEALSNFKETHHLPEQIDFNLLWITFLRVEYCLDCIKNPERLELGEEEIEALTSLVDESIQALLRLQPEP